MYLSIGASASVVTAAVINSTAAADSYSNSICAGSRHVKKIALTLDDGVFPQKTLPILDILKKYRIKVTFFLIGKLICKHPEITKIIAREGHIIANHTFRHENLTNISEQEIYATLNKTNKAIESVGLPSPQFFRAPYGELDERVYKVAKELKLQHIGWDIDTKDWDSKKPEEFIINKIRHKTKNGSIILTHDGDNDGIPQRTSKILNIVIPELLGKGFQFVSIPELVADNAGKDLIRAASCYSLFPD